MLTQRPVFSELSVTLLMIQFGPATPQYVFIEMIYNYAVRALITGEGFMPDIDDEFVVIKNHEETHTVTYVSGYPFYQSTGKASGYSGTWFPFNGFLEYETIDVPRGWLVKPKSWFSSEPEAPILYWLLSEKRELERNLVQRFGGIDGICISCCFGGGFWNTEKGRLVEQYLNDNFEEFISGIKDEVSKKKQKLTGVEKEINHTSEDADIRSTNEWLCRNTGRQLIMVKFGVDEKVSSVLPSAETNEEFYNALYQAHLGLKKLLKKTILNQADTPLCQDSCRLL